MTGQEGVLAASENVTTAGSRFTFPHTAVTQVQLSLLPKIDYMSTRTLRECRLN